MSTTPTKVAKIISSSSAWIHVQHELGSREKAEQAIFLGGSVNAYGHGKIVIWTGHEFEITSCRSNINTRGAAVTPLGSHDRYVELHYPIDRRMTEEDISGATIAYPNEDNTAWLFAFCDEDFMLDYEHRLEAASASRFAKEINDAQVKVNEATNTTIKAKVVGIHRNLVTFCDDVIEFIHEEARTRHIGYYQQNPLEGHIHVPIKRAIDAVTLDWIQNKSTEYGTINTIVGRVLKTLTNQHTYETRWDRDARLEAEAKAAEEAASSEPEESESGES